MTFDRAWLKKVSLFALAALCFSSSLWNEFALDDLIHIRMNESIRSLSRALTLFKTPTYPGDLYRPLSTFTYALNYVFSGLTPYSYHLVNVLLHGAVTVLVYIVFLRFLPAASAELGAIIFAVAPIHTEAVANVVGRAELLTAFFGLSYILLGLRIVVDGARSNVVRNRVVRNSATYILLASCLLLALLSKESAIVCPLLLLVLSLHLSKVTKPSKELSVVGAASAAAVICFLALRWNALGGIVQGAVQAAASDNPLLSLPMHLRLLKAFALLGKYLALCIVPYPLSADYSFAQLSPYWDGSLDLLYSALTLAVLCSCFLHSRKTSRPFAIWFFVAFLVTGNFFFPIGTIFGERLAYLPSVGVYGLIAGMLGASAIASLRPFILGVIAVFAGQCFVHSEVWYNNYSLHSYQIGVSPLSTKTRTNYAVVLRNQGKLREAIEHVKVALDIDPNDDSTYFVAGTIYLKLGDSKAALTAWNRALKLNPSHIDTRIALGEFYFNSGEIDQSRGQFESVLRIEPSNVSAKIGQAMIWGKTGKYKEAAAAYDDLKERDPHNTAVHQLGLLLRSADSANK